MPDRIFGKDELLSKHFTAEDLTGVEYADGHYISATCKACGTRWGLAIGEQGEVPASARNPLLAHLAAHNSNGARVRPPLFKLPRAPQ